MTSNRTPLLALGSAVLFALLVVSGLEPFDRVTWVAEVAPVVIAWPILFATRRRFPLTPLVYGLIFLHGVILIYGGAYSYARVPLGFEVAELLDLERNPYDKLGHFAQGFVPALIAREILIRGAYVDGPRMLAFLVVSVVLAISATYELIEWAAALLLGQGAEEFLGTQGDPWDTQSDMFTALLGALAALGFFSSLHDRQIRRVEEGLVRTGAPRAVAGSGASSSTG
jgi:putative membrane protein